MRSFLTCPGVFGFVNSKRYVVTVSLRKDATWHELAYKAIPSEPSRTPPLVAPYHYRFDWQVLFVLLLFVISLFPFPPFPCLSEQTSNAQVWIETTASLESRPRQGHQFVPRLLHSVGQNHTSPLALLVFLLNLPKIQVADRLMAGDVAIASLFANAQPLLLNGTLPDQARYVRTFSPLANHRPTS